jgi:hypothetical protein
VGGVAWVGLLRLPGRAGLVSWRAAGLVATLLLVGRSFGLAQDVADSPRGQVLPAEPVARELLDQLDEEVPDDPVLVRGRGLRGLSEAVIDELDRRGAAMRVDEGLGYKWGRHRTATRDEVSSVWFVVEAGVTVSLVTDLPGARVLARLSPLDPAEEREAVALQRRLAAQLQGAGRDDLLPRLDSSLVAFAAGGVRGVDLDALDRLGALNRRVETSASCRCAVVAVPPGAPGVDDIPGMIDPTSTVDP